VATVPAEVQGPSDAELIDSVRKGTLSAYGELYERHVSAAYNLARQLSRSQAESDDLVSEAFAKVLDTLKAGRGPDSAFRAYLLTALRHTAYDKTRRDRKVELSDDVSQVSGVSAEAVSVPFSDPAVAGLERTLAARAFARLPERWQAVLWHTEIEGQSPADVAPILGLTPNGVSALAYRAREGLKQAYLQVYLADNPEQRCRATTDRLGAWTRDGLSKRERAQVESHLDECARCRALAAELADVNSALRVWVAPLVLGSGTLGYLATAATAAKAVVAGGAIAAGAGVAAAGSAVTSGGGGAAGGAAASVPRQFVGVAASAAALAAAIALGLTAGGGNQDIPQAAGPTPAPAQQPPPPNPPANPPVPPPVKPPPPTQQPPTTTTPPTTTAPTPPRLTATPPAVPISLIAGGDSVDLPLTVRNNGGSLSGPVSATLALPPGVTAIPSGPSRFAAAPMLRLNGAAASSTVFCPGGTGSVTCGTSAGLPPGDSVTMVFRLVAAANSPGGEVTGTVSDGTAISVRVAVKVMVRPPAAVDNVDVLASGEWFDTLLPGLLGKRLVHVTATNTGTSAKPITLTIDRTGGRLNSTHQVTCTRGGGHTTTCTTNAPVPPGGVVKLSFTISTGLLGLHCPDGPIVVKATLGTATDTANVRTDCWTLPLPGLLPNGNVTTPPPLPPPPPPRPPVKPHVQPPPAPQAPVATPANPPSPVPKPLPDVVPSTPAAPPQNRSPLPPLLGWLLPY
jgi:RNA polymerase sigma factor (sigma-70 family)